MAVLDILSRFSLSPIVDIFFPYTEEQHCTIIIREPTPVTSTLSTFHLKKESLLLLVNSMYCHYCANEEMTIRPTEVRRFFLRRCLHRGGLDTTAVSCSKFDNFAQIVCAVTQVQGRTLEDFTTLRPCSPWRIQF